MKSQTGQVPNSKTTKGKNQLVEQSRINVPAGEDPMTYYATQISGSWRRTLEFTLITAKWCTQANNHLLDRQKKVLRKSVGMSPALFSKLVKIGECELLHRQELRAKLPSSLTPLYECAMLDESQFELLLKQKVITPKVSRDVIRDFRLEGTLPEKNVVPKPNVVAGFVLKDGVQWTSKRQAKLAELEQSLPDVKLVFAKTDEQKQEKRRQSRKEKALLTEAKKLAA